MPHRFPNTANSAEIVGRTPRSAWGVLVPHPEQRFQHLARREGPTGASAADQGVRPTTYADCPLPGKLCSIGPPGLSLRTGRRRNTMTGQEACPTKFLPLRGIAHHPRNRILSRKGLILSPTKPKKSPGSHLRSTLPL